MMSDKNVESWLADGERLREAFAAEVSEIRTAFEQLEAQRRALEEKLVSKETELAKMAAILDLADDVPAKVQVHDSNETPNFASKAGGPSSKPQSRADWHPNAA